MTSRSKLSLPRSPSSSPAESPRRRNRPPVRGAGSAPRSRTLPAPAPTVPTAAPPADKPKPKPRPAAPPLAPVPTQPGERLSKRMSELGLASRHEADLWIERGWVRVDGQVVDTLGARVLPHQRIEVDPAARHEQEQRVTILLNKPIGYVSGQAEDGHEPAVVLITPENHWKQDPSALRFGRHHLRKLAPAGRLDIDSTGLLVLTQDGRVARHLIGEDSTVEKEYLVRVEHPGGDAAGLPSQTLPPEQLALLRHGLSLDGQALKPAQVSWQNEHQLRFVLREGRKRQIRRMCELVGLKVVGLKRIRIGRVVLGALPAGQWRYLGPHERF
jgi:23S rRNA pseudouridine2604 synthase